MPAGYMPDYWDAVRTGEREEEDQDPYCRECSSDDTGELNMTTYEQRARETDNTVAIRLAAEADAEITRLQAQVAELQAKHKETEDIATGALHGALESIAAYRAQVDALAGALSDLVAMVRGECPSLLEEDSGGSAHLSMRIDAALAQAGR